MPLLPLILLPLAMTSPIDAPDSFGRTPLLLAVEANDVPEATQLIAAGANLNAQAANNRPSLAKSNT